VAIEPKNVTYFTSPGTFRTWLEANHSREDELWVGYWKKPTGRPSLSWEESVDEALCFGWIDGIRKRIDDDAFTIRFTPRRSTSVWSRRNMERYEALLAEGRVCEEGVRAFERRREDRSGLYSFEQKIPPSLSDEYVARLRAVPEAWTDWQSRPPGYRRRATHWVMSAKKEETRERRMEAVIEECAAGRKVKPLR
jgi:uncharacterized protein YdeI (YjbR/CyaY-like superfamily)